MSRVCAVSGKKPLAGNNVSHANNRTKRRFLPNIQDCSFPSEILGTRIRLSLTPRGIRTVEKHGGIDTYLMTARNSRLSPELLKLKKRLAGAKAKKAA